MCIVTFILFCYNISVSYSWATFARRLALDAQLSHRPLGGPDVLADSTLQTNYADFHNQHSTGTFNFRLFFLYKPPPPKSWLAV